MISVAKYLYRDITDEDEAENFEDIAVIRTLSAARKKIPRKKNKSIDLIFTWDEILKVRDAWLVDFNDPYSYSHRKATSKKSARIEKVKRSEFEMSRSLQKFLAIYFLTVIPTDRIRTIRELKLGKTLKYGIKTELGFVSVDKMSTPEKAKYYIHLESEDYKTGDSHGEFWGEIINCIFFDGSYFYDYLDKWLYQGYRQKLLSFDNQNHDFVFMKSRKSTPLDKDASSALIRYAFNSKSGFKLNPHRIRHIFRTYVERRTDISAKEKESIAKWMHHSSDIAQIVYTNLNAQEELQPGFEAMQRINNQM